MEGVRATLAAMTALVFLVAVLDLGSKGGRMYRIVLHKWWPTRLNLLMRMHWAQRNHALKADAQRIGLEAWAAEVPKARGRRRVSLVVRRPKGYKQPDDDAFWKSLLDGLVACSLLVDDSPRWLEMGAVSHEVSPNSLKALVVQIEELEGDGT